MRLVSLEIFSANNRSVGARHERARLQGEVTNSGWSYISVDSTVSAANGAWAGRAGAAVWRPLRTTSMAAAAAGPELSATRSYLPSGSCRAAACARAAASCTKSHHPSSILVHICSLTIAQFFKTSLFCMSTKLPALFHTLRKPWDTFQAKHVV